jgi:alcohol dehydrogenase class IV
MNGTKIQMRRYACETRVVSGLGVLSLLPDELKYYKIKNPALVSDAGIANAGLLEKWFPPEISGLKTRILSKVNPNLDDANAASELARSNGCDGVIIVGGGSALCLGKAVSIMLTNPGQISQYEGDSKTTSVSAGVHSLAS